MRITLLFSFQAFATYLFFTALATPSYLLLRRFLPLRPGRIFRIAAWCIQGVAVGMIIWPADENLILTLPFYFVILLICSAGSLLSRVSIIGLFFSLSMSISGFCCNLPVLMDEKLPEQFSWPIERVIILGLWLALYLLCRRFYPDDGTYPVLSPRFWVLTDLFALLAFGTLLAVVALPMSLNAPFDNDYYTDPVIWRYFRGLWLALYLLCRRFYPDDGTYPVLSPRFWVLTDLFALLAFGTLLAVVALPMSLNAPFDNDYYTDPVIWRYFRVQILLISPLIFAGALGALIAIVVLSRHEQLERGQMLYEVNRAYYSQLEQTQLQVRRLRHDMANHLQAMRALDGDALHRYIDDLIDSPAMRSQTHYCENTVVNAVLQNKEPRIASLHIDAEIAVSLPADLPIQDLDLCALFANGLDNAIEACARMPVHERRLSVRARADKGLLIVRMRNRTPDLTPLAPDNLPETHKRDRENHGFGLMNLRAIAARYQGSMELQRAGGMFELLVTLPLKEHRQV